ncbi:MAG: hypothetical protein U9O20_02380 [Patescibacteria group bacterium]|nr:hypothetical protein [Patescibacteria group bacterium]
MDISDFQSLLKKSKNILLVIPPEPSDDVLSSAFGMYRFLKKHGKKISFLSKNQTPQRLSFLDAPDNTTRELSGLRDFVLVFKTKHNKIVDHKTEERDGEYIVRITPEKGSIDPRDFSFMPADFKHDLLILVGTPSLETLGHYYHQNTDLFFEVPKINIDNQNSNENYAQVNIVDMAASSVAEVCTQLIKEVNEDLLDQKLAQSLLTGIIAATESFQKPITTPKAMIAAAYLMKYKAEQPIIIRHLYKTKSLPFLKLWGRVMARLNWDKKKKAVWSLISSEDFVQSRASEDDIPYILEEIQKNFSQGHIFAIFYAGESGNTTAQLRFTDKSKAQQLATDYEAKCLNNSFKVELKTKNLLQAEEDFTNKIERLE